MRGRCGGAYAAAMRRFIDCLLIFVLILPPLWLFTARWCITQLDRVYTVTQALLPSDHVGLTGLYFLKGRSLQIGDTVGSADGPKDGWNADLTQGSHVLDPGPLAKLTSDEHDRLIVTYADQTFVLGMPAGTMPGADGQVAAFRPDRGDKVSITIEHSALAWPTPFEVNFMTGYVHRWRRWLYYRLIWEKASGQRLTMVWKYEQGWHQQDHWTRPYPWDFETGLIRVDIQPAR